MAVFFAGFKYFRWGYRYPEFLRVLKDLFLANPQHTKTLESWRVKDPYCGGFVFQLKNGETTEIKPKFEYHGAKQYYPVIICGLPDGKYRVEGAFDEAGSPYFITVTNGGYNDEEMTIAGAYMWWCVQSSNPTGHTTLHLGDEDYDSYYHEGLCRELYHCHNAVEKVHFNLDTRTVCLKTNMHN